MTINTQEALDKHADLFQFIPVGEENCISRKELSALMNLSERAVYNQIRAARQDSVIAFGDRGYYIPNSFDELTGYVRRCQKRNATGKLAMVYAEKRLWELERMNTIETLSDKENE